MSFGARVDSCRITCAHETHAKRSDRKGHNGPELTAEVKYSDLTQSNKRGLRRGHFGSSPTLVEYCGVGTPTAFLTTTVTSNCDEVVGRCGLASWLLASRLSCVPSFLKRGRTLQSEKILSRTVKRFSTGEKLSSWHASWWNACYSELHAIFNAFCSQIGRGVESDIGHLADSIKRHRESQLPHSGSLLTQLL